MLMAVRGNGLRQKIHRVQVSAGPPEPIVTGANLPWWTVDEARRRIVEAMELFVADARRVKIVDDVKLPANAARLRAYATLRKKAHDEERRSAQAARRAVRVLRGGRLKMSARDAARLLGLSHQRVHQLTQAAADER